MTGVLFFVAIFKTCERIDQKMYEGYKLFALLAETFIYMFPSENNPLLLKIYVMICNKIVDPLHLWPLHNFWIAPKILMTYQTYRV